MARKKLNADIFNKIFELKWAEPFKPFTLKTADGQSFVIAQRESIGRSPDSKIIVFSAAGEGWFHRVPIGQIIAVGPVRSGKTGSPRIRSTSRR